MSRRFGKDSPSAVFEAKKRDFELERKKREVEVQGDLRRGTQGKKDEEVFKLTERELNSIKGVFNIYDEFGEDAIDSGNLPDALRALGLNPTLALVEKIAGTVKPGEKKFPLEEFAPIYAQCKNDKDNGVYEDFIECLKLYDKAENGYMPLGELTHALTALGERLTNEELETVLEDCMDEEDDEGYIPYIPFLARMCEKPVPKNIKPL